MYEWIHKVTTEEKYVKLHKWVHHLPQPVIHGLCFLLSRVLYLSVRDLRKRMFENMLDLLKDQSPRQIQHYLRSYFYQFTIILYEILFESSRIEKIAPKKFIMEGEGYLHEALQSGRGAIVFSPHLGNFFYYYWYLSRKYDCLTVATGGSPELRPLYLLFQRMGCVGLDYDAVPPIELVKTLRKHLKGNGVVFLLGDFWRPNFPQARFFNRLTRSPGGAAMMALEYQVPIVPFYGYRLENSLHRLQFAPPVYLYEKWDSSQRTQAMNELNQILEEIVRKKPDQWFYWFNVQERWEQESTDPERCQFGKGGDTVA